MSAEKKQAAQEALFCADVLAKTGDNVLLETLGGTERIETWAHYPKGDVFDSASGAQWYYHCHEPGEAGNEHGHFHCFVRPQGAEGPVHHLAAVGVDAYGRLIRIFTVNHWVVGDNWLGAEKTVELLPKFDVQLGRPSYLVNRWLTAILRLYEDEIADLIRKRDAVLAAHEPADGGDPKEDRSLEVTSELKADLQARATELGL